MAPTRLPHLLRHLHRLLDGRCADGPDDAELLRRFTEGRDEAAFEVLVWRHGPMVHNLCRRLLRRAADADDAFQATFLILVRKARSISRGASLAGWLYRVAYRVALEARAREARQTASAYEDDFADPRSADDAERRELRRAVAEEVERLPEKYRLPVVLCYLSGWTTEEAARRLGCPRGTVLSRLAAARRRLHGRLTRRGLAPTAGAVVAALGRKATAGVPAALVGMTVKAVLGLTASGAGGVSGSVLSLMEGALKAMLMKKIKWAAAVLTAAALVGGGVGLWFRQPAAAESPVRTRQAEPAAKAPDEPKEEAVEVRGPVGVWEKDFGGTHMTLRIKDNHRIYGSCDGVGDDGSRFDFTINADYSITRDSILYGVITDVGLPTDGNAQGAAKDRLDDQLKQGLEMTQMLDDQPFSLRYRLDGDVLSVKAVKFGDPKGEGGEATVFLLGRWKKKADAHDAAGGDGR